MYPVKSITGVVLAGGRGRRVSGRDKGLMPLDGKPLVAHVIDAIQPQVDVLVISANRNAQIYAQWGFDVFSDDLGDYWGPLAGMATVMAQVKTSHILTVSCDMPRLPNDLVSRMREALTAESAELCFVDDGVREHYAIALIPCALQSDIRAYLKVGQRRLGSWLNTRAKVKVDFSDKAPAFININSLDDYRRLTGHQSD